MENPRYGYRVYYKSACAETEKTVSRHRTPRAAIIAARRAQHALRTRYGRDVLCGYTVQEWDGEDWTTYMIED